ncbi:MULTISPECIES: [FeFe] hydrogenase, group A [Fusobacterium]|uniref:[FeFe] hydrogenase, group A n=1 Tax=Fusobacterium TaxID=848 RepID=UPI00103089DE|nr:[FeFe] hydrogenase, group A [Fusobacterium ulcerans]
MTSKNIILQSSFGSVFSTVEDIEEREGIESGSRMVVVAGRVNNPGVIAIPENATLNDVIGLAGGIKNKKSFKAAQFGLPFGGFLTKKSLDKVIDFSLFPEGIDRNIIILSEEDCIVSFAKFYVEFLMSKIERSEYIQYTSVQNEIERIWRILDRISKGKANMRDIYLLRCLSETIKTELNQRHNLVLESIEEFYDEIEEHIEEHKCAAGQCIHLLKFRITEKCIGCTACARVCPVKCISGKIKERHILDTSRCTHCGQCVAACPVGAIFEGDHTMKLLKDLATPNRIVVVQIAPAVRVAIGEAFGFEAGTNVEKKLVGALKKLGVNYVFDTTWAADITVMEEASEFQERLERYYKGDDTVRLPILTSCCPAWVKFIEQSYPDMLDVPSSVKSPMQIFSTIAKDIWAKEKGYVRERVSVVGIMPCLAKKYEASRPEFSRGDNYDTDYVISTRELIKIFKESGIDLKNVEEKEFDNPLGEYSGAGIIFGRTGGVIEAATRSTIEMITGTHLDEIEFKELRGWEGFRTAELTIGHIELRIGIAHGLEEAAKMLDKIRAGEEFFHAIEIMACKGGCIGGGGQPKAVKKQETLEKRAEGLNAIDRGMKIRRSHENPYVKAIYDKYLDYPLSHKAHELLHTKYFPKIKNR